MKKFVVIDSVGNWGYENGKKIIDCSVKGYQIIAQSDIPSDLASLVPHKVEYREDGTWHSYRIETRARARRDYPSIK